MESEKMSEKLKLTQKQKEMMKKIFIYTIMGIACAAFLYWIYAPKSKDVKNAQSGFNTSIPTPKEKGLIEDKREAYEKEQVKEKQTARMQSLQDFSALISGNDSTKTDVDLALITDTPKASASVSAGKETSSKTASIQNSAMAYRDINRSLGNFYETPKNDPEKEKMKQELEDLKARMEASEARKNEVNNQLALMEKSFQMAAKYIPTNQEGTAAAAPVPVAGKAPVKGKAPEKSDAMPVTAVRERTVSVLQAGMSDAEFIDTYSKDRNTGFHTVTAETGGIVRNTVLACVLADQTVMDGESVRFRLMEPMRVGKMYIPFNTQLTGQAKIQGERLQITVSSLEYSGSIIPVEITVYDTDGQRGIFIPNIEELNAAKEIAANMGTNAGTSINLSNDAEKQFVADMGRNVIQGASQYFSKKMRQVKVHLKAGYKVFLVASSNSSKGEELAQNF